MLKAEGRLDIKLALNYLIQHCKELDPWLPIETAPTHYKELPEDPKET